MFGNTLESKNKKPAYVLIAQDYIRKVEVDSLRANV